MTERMNLSQYRAEIARSSVSPSGRVVAVARKRSEPQDVAARAPAATKSAATSAKDAMYALGRLKTGEMNGTESAYAALLESRKAAGEIVWYAFESITFKLADDTRYTPDFAVMLASGRLQAHEVKGHWQDDAKVKIKVAAALFPVEFIAMKRVPKKLGGGWAAEEF